MAGSDVIIGLDVGTTAAKASLFSLDAALRVTVSREYPLLNPRPGGHVQDPDAIAVAPLAAPVTPVPTDSTSECCSAGRKLDVEPPRAAPWQKARSATTDARRAGRVSSTPPATA